MQPGQAQAIEGARRAEPCPERPRDPAGARGQSLPLWHPSADPGGRDARGEAQGAEFLMVTARTTRREFIKGTGVLIVGFGLAEPMRAALGQPAPAGKTVATDEVDAFLSIARDGGVSVFTGKVDLGTGIRVALRQMAAEELDVPVDRINLVEGDTALTPDQGPTWGSLSVQVGGVQIRQAAATARKALVDMAAGRPGRSVGGAHVKSGIVRVRADIDRKSTRLNSSHSQIS